MKKTTFDQYKKCLDEIAKLYELAGTNFHDIIQNDMTDEQYNEVKGHIAHDALYV